MPKKMTDDQLLEALQANVVFTVRIETGNAAYDLNRNAELARQLRDIADAVEAGNESGNVQDVNGNTVGRYGIIL